MRVLVTGGAGFIGSHVLRRLLARGDSVHVLDNFTTGRAESLGDLDVNVFRGDVRDAAFVRLAVEGCGAVVHLAAQPSVPKSLEDPVEAMSVNAGGTLTVLEAVRPKPVPVVYASSCAVYGDSGEAPQREDQPPAPMSPYAAGKLAGEWYARASGLPVVSLRFFNVFGARQDPGSAYAAVIPKFIDCALKGVPAPIYGDGLQTRDFIHVDRVVDAIEAGLRAPKEAWGRVVNVASGRRTSLLDLLAALERVLGRRVEREFLPARTGEIRHSLADVTEAKRLLGLTADAFEDGLRRTVESYRAGR